MHRMGTDFFCMLILNKIFQGGVFYLASEGQWICLGKSVKPKEQYRKIDDCTKNWIV